MTPLRQRMLDAMSVRGFRPSTQQCYADAIYGLAKHYRGDPTQYSAQEIEAYLLHLVQERHLSYSTMNQAASAARFLYEKVTRAKDAWLQGCLNEVLDVPYCHLVFTLPHSLNSSYGAHPR